MESPCNHKQDNTPVYKTLVIQLVLIECWLYDSVVQNGLLSCILSVVTPVLQNNFLMLHFFQFDWKWMDSAIYLLLLDRKRSTCWTFYGNTAFKKSKCWFAGKRTGVQAQLKDHAPHSIFVHCHYHKLQPECVQAAATWTKIWRSLWTCISW